MTIDIESAVDKLLSIENEKLNIEQKPYDGISGCPPEWVPETIVNNFRKHRDTMLYNWQYTHVEAVEWITRFATIGDDNDNWFYPANYPNGLELEPSHFTDVIGYLAHLNYCSSLSPKEGITLLAGKDAASGYKNRNNISPRSSDELTSLLKELFHKLYTRNQETPSSKAMLNELEEHGERDYNSIIESVSWQESVVIWESKNGKAHHTKFKSILNRLSKIRKEYLKQISRY